MQARRGPPAAAIHSSWSLHSNFSQQRSLAFQWRPLGLSIFIYFVSTNTLFAQTRTHSPSTPYFQAMWASSFNSPSHPPLSLEMPLWATEWLMRILTCYLRSRPATRFVWRKLARSCVGTCSDACLPKLNLEFDGSCGSAESKSRSSQWSRI